MSTCLPSARRLLAAALFTVTIVGATPDASAQSDAADLRPPQPGKDPSAPSFVTAATLLLLAAGLGVASFLPSKRGHQD